MHVHGPRPNTARDVPLRSFFPHFMRLLIRPMQSKLFPGNIRCPKFMDVSRRRGHHGHLDLRSLFDQPYNGELPSFVRRGATESPTGCTVASVFLGPPIFRRPNEWYRLVLARHTMYKYAQGVCRICAEFPKRVLNRSMYIGTSISFDASSRYLS